MQRPILLIIFFLTGSIVSVKSKYIEDKITPLENKALKKFRSTLGMKLPNDYMNQDGYLINWIRGTTTNDDNLKFNIKKNATTYSYTISKEFGFDLQKAKENLKKALKYRKEHNLDNILKEDLSELEKQFPVDYSRVDKDGRPLIVAEYGKWNLKEATISRDSQTRIARYLVYILEKGAKLARDNGGFRVTYLIDVGGFDTQMHSCESCLGVYTEFFQRSEMLHPQIINRYLQVNAPKEFEGVRRLILDNIPKDQQDGFKIYDNNKSKWINEVKNYINIDQIPQEFIESTPKTTTTTTTAKPEIPFYLRRTCAGCSIPGKN